ncbi:hypothetical protein ILUMI_10776 [Ignelater luminosus]|uniref:Uncharacterized protein n=1 Tax=Ignelater luminosus TaxID=2038154 RepID=A0A8K0D1I0_IGNLU|nr:hypothetical protein ILUMI_10776 [Ignelater luminosus]
MLKSDPTLSAEALHPIFSMIWEDKLFPKDWLQGILVKIPKKGDLSLLSARTDRHSNPSQKIELGRSHSPSREPTQYPDRLSTGIHKVRGAAVRSEGHGGGNNAVLLRLKPELKSRGKGKVQTLFDMLISQYQSGYGPSKELSIDDLGHHKIAAQWNPQLLTDEEKNLRSALSLRNLMRYQQQSNAFLPNCCRIETLEREARGRKLVMQAIQEDRDKDESILRNKIQEILDKNDIEEDDYQEKNISKEEFEEPMKDMKTAKTSE